LAWKKLEEREAEEEEVELFLAAVMIWVPTSQNLLSISDSQSVFQERNRRKILKTRKWHKIRKVVTLKDEGRLVDAWDHS
jgi:hypothetical protein